MHTEGIALSERDRLDITVKISVDKEVSIMLTEYRMHKQNSQFYTEINNLHIPLHMLSCLLSG